MCLELRRFATWGSWDPYMHSRKNQDDRRRRKSREKGGEREDWELSVSSLSRTNVVIIWLLLMSLSNYYLLATSWQVQDAGSSIHERFYERFYGLEGGPAANVWEEASDDDAFAARLFF